jgi:hypothetical protein
VRRLARACGVATPPSGRPDERRADEQQHQGCMVRRKGDDDFLNTHQNLPIVKWRAAYRSNATGSCRSDEERVERWVAGP